ncbi:MAG: ATP-binding protein [Pseudomonadota bacterium]
MTNTLAEMRLAALDLFSQDRTLTFLWADRLGTITSISGDALPTAQPGLFLTDALPMLLGLESDLSQLLREPDRNIELANIAVVSQRTGPLQRLNISVRWNPAIELYVILVAKSLSRAAFEVELQQQVRARQLAESMLLEQTEDIQSMNSALAHANADLAQFARVVSHDLKEPMRAMHYFADDLEESLANPARGDPRMHVDRMRAQSKRMMAMLSSLLAYATVDRKSDVVETLATAELLDEIIQSLPKPNGLTVAVSGDWPVLSTIDALFDLVLRNLIENAIRHATPAPGAVAVTGYQQDLAFVMTVADNGSGIPEGDQDAIFLPFTKLRAQVDASAPLRDKPENTGMGLALVRRAVETVGGEITVQNGGPGAVFTVTWPTGLRPTA